MNTPRYMKKELATLERRISRLQWFIALQYEYNKLPIIERESICKQLQYMKWYRDELKRRIERVEK